MNSQKADFEEVNLGDVMRLALPIKTVVIAGAGQARRLVNWVVLLTEWKDINDQVRAGDLVILPPVLQSKMTNAGFQTRFESLSSLMAACLLVFHPVSDEISEFANRLNFPLLVLPAGSSVRETHQAVAALLIDRKTATNERGMQLYRMLSEMSREGQGLLAMTDVMSNLTGKIIIVQDKRLEIQATSSPQNTSIDLAELENVLNRRDQLPAVLRNRKAAAKARQSYWQQILPIENVGRIISPIISGDRARGYLSVVGPAGELDLLDCLTAEHGAAACALEMAKAKAVSEAKKSLRGDFLEGLLAGTLPDKEIERLASRLDHDTSTPHAILAFTWDGSNTPSIRRLETTLNWLLADHTRSALVHAYGDQHVCVFQTLRDGEDMQTAFQLARRLRTQVEAEFPEARLVGGISGPVTALVDWPAVYQEALQSMQHGQKLKLNHLVEFSSLGVYQLLGQLEDVPAVRVFTKQIIGPLVDYDRAHGSSLVQTLDAYFNHHGNISQTAESLFIHRNTLLYRLDRIQELTHQDLDQANRRLALQLALKFWQLHPEN